MKFSALVPWKSVVQRVARTRGFLDPIVFFGRLRAFAKPSEVSEPIELLRAGVVFHARGLINTKAIQFNLDWVWPYWVERQFNPEDESFVPRAFSFSHINLTHRNWTAVGLPDVPHYSIVDPRGLVTPFFDGWSLDFWIVGTDDVLLPSKSHGAAQQLDTGETLRVQTCIRDKARQLVSDVWMEWRDGIPACVIRIQARAVNGDSLIISARPYNPEGISFIDSIRYSRERREWIVNGKHRVQFSNAPTKVVMSSYALGDVFHSFALAEEQTDIECSVGMATAAAVFPLESTIEITIPLEQHGWPLAGISAGVKPSWPDEIAKCSRLKIPDERIQRLFDAAVSTLLLHTPCEVYPGPYTYKRFWYRDAALILNALITLGARERTRRALDIFPKRQQRNGYFLSQEGEWDSNGEALWILERYLTLANEPVPHTWVDVIERGARWIARKRSRNGSPHSGLLPAGFSAEHLGPNDFYYWDDFWGVAGLRAAEYLLKKTKPELAREFESEAQDFLQTIQTSIARAARRTHDAIPAAPDRRMDSGAVGSLVADYPLHLFPAGDQRILNTVEWLLAHSFVRGGFFQNMIHSGINAYLTLDIAQTLLRAGDARFVKLIDAVAALASPTGQWPEAIHPRTLGGCMGDGQHVWAAAEWAMMIRNCFVREEVDRLVIGSGILPRWLEAREPIEFERTLTRFGEVSVCCQPGEGRNVELQVCGLWHNEAPAIEISIPGLCVIEEQGDGKFRLTASHDPVGRMLASASSIESANAGAAEGCAPTSFDP